MLMHTRILRGLVALALLISLVSAAGPAAAASGRDLYVSGTGNDQGSGTSPGSAWRTLQRAVDAAGPGDTIWVLDGTYEGFLVAKSGQADGWIRIVAEPGASPVVDAGDGKGIHLSNSSYIEVRGLELRGDADRAQSPNGIGILVTGASHHLRFVQNNIHHFGAGGLITYQSGDHLEIYHNRIHHNANWNPDQHSGLSLLGLRDDGSPNDAADYSNYVIGNLIYDNEVKVTTTQFGQGDRVTDGNCFVVDVTLESNYPGRTLFGSNICVDNGGRGTQVYKGGGVDIVNNTFYLNMTSPDVAAIGSEVMAYDSRDVRFANNLIISRPDVLPLTAGASSEIVFRNNLTVGTINPAKSPSDSHLGYGTPVLANPSTDDAALTVANFTPRASSAAIDVGDTGFAAALPVDFAGNVRTAGSAVDAGAVERGAAASAAWPWASPAEAPAPGQDPAPPTRPSDVPASSERALAVGRLYSAAFLRAPDSEGLAYWTNSRAGMLDIAYAFSVSAEFVNRYGTLDDGGFVDLMYRNVLGRAPDSAGFAYWTDRMANGMTRSGVLLYFSESAEYRAKIRP